MEKKKLLARAEQMAIRSGCNTQVRELNKEVNELMVKENKMWRQRAKFFWLIGGGKSTKYFHSKATQRHRRNRISGLYNSDGVWISHQEGIANTFTNFYKGLFTSTNPVLNGEAMDPVPKLITDDMNALLTQDFTEGEVQVALKQMAFLKAPRPNGMPPYFIKIFRILLEVMSLKQFFHI